jgi:RNA polymerase sigma-B factor
VLVGRLEEKRLCLAYQRSGDRRDRDAVVERFLPLAYNLARRYGRGSEPLEDLQQVASLALVRAVEGFDASRGTAFTSYAVPSIVGAIKRHFRDCGWSMRVPRDLQELALRVERFSQQLSAETGSSPTPTEVAGQAGLSVEQVLEAREAYRAMRSDSLDQPRHSGEDGSGSLLDRLGGRDVEISRAFDRVALEPLLEALDERGRLIVHLYYHQELTQAEIGRRLGYSQMHISRLLRQATDRLHQVGAARPPSGRQLAQTLQLV